jgi:hypothetical protein
LRAAEALAAALVFTAVCAAALAAAAALEAAVEPNLPKADAIDEKTPPPCFSSSESEHSQSSDSHL